MGEHERHRQLLVHRLLMIDGFDIDALNVAEFPYHAAFYTYVVDVDVPLNEQVTTEKLVYETEADIQKRSGLRQNTALLAEYTCYFPLPLNPGAKSTIDKYGPVPIRRGMTIRAEAYGYSYEGIVEMIRFSQLGGCSVDFRVSTETDV